jgi:ribosomal protein S2
MADIINLKAVKKAKARAEKERTAEANRAKHGRTKDERSRTEAEQDRLDHTLDGAKMDDD